MIQGYCKCNCRIIYFNAIYIYLVFLLFVNTSFLLFDQKQKQVIQTYIIHSRGLIPDSPTNFLTMFERRKKYNKEITSQV